MLTNWKMSKMTQKYKPPAERSCPKRFKTIESQRKDGARHLSKYLENIRIEFKLQSRLSSHVRKDSKIEKGRLSRHIRKESKLQK